MRKLEELLLANAEPLKSAWRWRGGHGDKGLLALSLSLMMALGQSACSTIPEARSGDFLDPLLKRVTEFDHRSCPAGNSEKSLRMPEEGKRLILGKDDAGHDCKILDLDGDGFADVYIYTGDATGTVIRRETDYDRDGFLDEVEILENGILKERHRITRADGNLDTWEYFDARGEISKIERDSDGDGFVDQWWEFPQGRKGDCPIIHADISRDGKADVGATIDLCEGSYIPPEKYREDRKGFASEQSKGPLVLEEREALEGEIVNSTDEEAMEATEPASEVPSEDKQGSK